MTAVPALVTGDMRAAFDRSLTRADETSAVSLVLGLLDGGVSAEDLLLELIAPAQAIIGARWVANEWTVAQEHAAVHVSDQVISALAVATRDVRGDRGSVVVACPDGEWHSLPARVVSEVLRLRGFTVRFLGAAVPTAHLLSYLHRHDADVLAISCTLAIRLPRVYRTIEACRLVGIPVLAGGSGFGPAGVWAHTLGADLYAPNAVQAAELLARSWPPPLNGHVSLDHLADGEYAELMSRRSSALDAVLERLHHHFTALGNFTEETREIVAENVGFLLDNLAASVFVDDHRAFSDFLDFTADLLAARGVPPSGLPLAMQALYRQLHGLPRTMGHVTAGRDWLEFPDHTFPTTVSGARRLL